MTKKYILGLDEGTTSLRSVLYDVQENCVVQSFKEPIGMRYPHNGWVEQDGEEIYKKSLKVLEKALELVPNDEVVLGVTNQREAVLLWDKSGKSLTPVISWQCRRTADMCQKLINAGQIEYIKRKTGLVVDAYFSATKIKWLLDNTPNAKKLLEKGELYAGTIDSYLIYRLSNGASHITDGTNASRTMLLNIHTAEWDEDLLKLFGVPKSILPTVTDSAGELATAYVGGRAIRICGVAGDQQASLFGQACFDKNECKCTYGTGAFLLSNVGESACITQSPLISTIAYKLNGKITYALEGSVFNAGSTIEWLISVGLIDSPQQSAELASQAEDTKDAFFVPAFTGLGAPYWDMNVRAGIVGMTFALSKGGIVRTALEGIAYSCAEVFALMESVSGTPLSIVKADGGMASNTYLMQFQSDVMQVSMSQSLVKEATAMGAIYLAGLGSGIFTSLEDIKNKHKVGMVYAPNEQNCSDMDGWRQAVSSLRNR